MATILFNEALLHDTYSPNISGGRGSWQYGLIADGGATGAVAYTPSGSAATHYRPFLKSSSYATTYVPHPGKFLAGGAANVTKLHIYGGWRPDITTITRLDTLEGDLLLTFPIPAYSASRGLTGMYVENAATDYVGFKAVCGICPTLTTAIASGVATWFWFGIDLSDTEAKVYNASYSGNHTNLSGYMFVTGSIGGLGSGADLEIADVNVAAGSQYKSFGFNFHLPAVNTISE